MFAQYYECRIATLISTRSVFNVFLAQFYSAQIRTLHGICVFPCMTHVGLVAEMWKFLGFRLQGYNGNNIGLESETYV